ncbi:MAG: HAD domain-containing protein [Actinomycetota bacterium]|nr:HAD domain-containing protein [Actinomycetota bacterium]
MSHDPHDRPILFVDVDGVISLFGFERHDQPPGTYQWVDGILHCIGSACGPLLRRLADRFELVWATGWEEKANEYLIHALGLDAELPTLTFDGRATFGSAHWKLKAIEEFAGGRPAAWIDDNLDDEIQTWAERRRAPTLLVRTETHVGITEEHVERLLSWADEVSALRG